MQHRPAAINTYGYEQGRYREHYCNSRYRQASNDFYEGLHIYSIGQQTVFYKTIVSRPDKFSLIRIKQWR